MTPILAVFGLDDLFYIFAAVSAITSAVGTYASYSASQQQAQQSKLNAQAQANAMNMEQQRQQQEAEQAMQRTALNQQRFRAQQEAALSANGLMGTTGSPLDILADTHTAQQRDLADIGYQNSTNNWQLQNQANASLSEGNSQSRAIMGQAGATLLSNAGTTTASAVQLYNSRPQKASSTY